MFSLLSVPVIFTISIFGGVEVVKPSGKFPPQFTIHIFCVYFLIVTIFISYSYLMDLCLLMLLTASCYR